MTLRETRHTQLLAHGFERLDSIGSKLNGYRLQHRGRSINVDVGPRGAVICWTIYADTTGRCISNRLTYDEVLTITA